MGCCLNMLEAEKIRVMLRQGGIARAVVINSCAVTNEALRQSRQQFHKVIRENPDVPVFITGCGVTLKPGDFIARFVDTPPVIDGVGSDAAWAQAEWQPIAEEWMYNTPPNITPVKSPADFSGKFKAVWTADRLYILAEITDDVISTTNTNPYVSPENNDCLELFIDHNESGGPRSNENGSNFFTYHLSFNGNNASDYIGTPNNTTTTDITQRIENGFILRNSHVNYTIGKTPPVYTWEIEMKVYDNTYPARSNPDTTPVTLTGGKMGFAVAYCDADAKNTREHFIGSMPLTGATDDERNKAYRDSTEYAKIHLVK